MKQEMKIKRNELKQLSQPVKLAIREGVYKTVNEGLVDMYKNNGHTEIHSFKQWLKMGYIVKKGEKALLLWAEPKITDDEAEESETKFYPLSYVFSQKQVQPLASVKPAAIQNQ